MNITLYTQPDCPPCKVTKMFLSHHGFTFIEIDISKDEKAKNHLINDLQSYSTPTVVVDKEVVKGFDLQKLEQILNI